MLSNNQVSDTGITPNHKQKHLREAEKLITAAYQFSSSTITPNFIVWVTWLVGKDGQCLLKARFTCVTTIYL